MARVSQLSKTPARPSTPVPTNDQSPPNSTGATAAAAASPPGAPGSFAGAFEGDAAAAAAAVELAAIPPSGAANCGVGADGFVVPAGRLSLLEARAANYPPDAAPAL